jgi:hypothetical protein
MRYRSPRRAGEGWGRRCPSHRRLAIMPGVPRPTSQLIARRSLPHRLQQEIYSYGASGAGGGAFIRTTSDTEVLLALLARTAYAAAAARMFAFAIWDTQSGSSCVARDPTASETLYYAQTGDGLLFASRIKALLASGGVLRASRRDGWVPSRGSVPEPWTFSAASRAASGPLVARAFRQCCGTGMLARHPCPLARGKMQGPSQTIGRTGTTGGERFCARPLGGGCAGERVPLRRH